MELFIIRHGQSANNALPNIRDREVDPPLTELGEQQAEIVAGYLVSGETHDIVASLTTNNSKFQLRQGFGITALFSSAMYRSLQTVQPIAKSLGLAPQIWVDLHEEGGMYRDHGGAEGLVGYPGRTRSEILAEFPAYQLPSGVTETGWWNQGREDLPSLLARAGRVSKQLWQMAEVDERVAMVSHGFFIDVLLKSLLGQDSGQDIYYRHHNTAISRLSINPGQRIEVLNLNRVDHLEPEMVS